MRYLLIIILCATNVATAKISSDNVAITDELTALECPYETLRDKGYMYALATGTGCWKLLNKFVNVEDTNGAVRAYDKKDFEKGT
jgi:hypothetical protein